MQSLTESQALGAYLARGSKVPKLHAGILVICHITRRHDITLNVNWKSRAHCIVQKVDDNSRFNELETLDFDVNNWGFGIDTVQEYQGILKYGGLLSKSIKLDVFADQQMARCEKYFSLHLDGVTRYAAFAQDSQAFACYIYLPIRWIAQTINHLIANKAQGPLTVPKWVSRPFGT